MCGVTERLLYTVLTHVFHFLFCSKTWYIPGPAPELSTSATLKLLSKKSGSKEGTVKLKFELDGKRGIYLTHLENWLVSI